MENSDLNQSDLDILNSEEPTKDEATKTESPVDEIDETEETEKEVEEDEETEKEPEKEPEEEDEEQVFEDSFTFKALKEAYPDIYKKFPGLRGRIARENEYAKSFPTVEEAKEAATELQGFKELGMSLVSGDPSKLLSELSTVNNGKSLEKLAKNFLPTLSEVNPTLFTATIVPYVNRVLREAQSAAKRQGNSNLYHAVQHLSNFLHDDPNVPEDREKNPEIERERKELEDRENKFINKQVVDFKRSTYKVTETKIINQIERGLDPENVLSEKQKMAVIRDTFDEINEVVRKDERFMNSIRSMFKQAEQSGLSREASDKVTLAYLARVRPLLSTVRQKVLADYLPKNQKNLANGKRHIPSSGSQGKESQGKLDPKKIDWGKTSDMDILNDKVTYKK